MDTSGDMPQWHSMLIIVATVCWRAAARRHALPGHFTSTVRWLRTCPVVDACVLLCRAAQVDVLLVGDRQSGPDSALAVLLAVVVAVGVLDGLSQGAHTGVYRRADAWAHTKDTFILWQTASFCA